MVSKKRAKCKPSFINGPANWLILDNCAILSCISVDILLAKTVLILVFCVVVEFMRHFFILKVFLSYSQCCCSFNYCCRLQLFSCVFVSSTLASSKFNIFIRLLHFFKETFSLVSLIFSKIVKTNIYWSGSVTLPLSIFLIVQRILLAELLLDQHLILFVF